ncbi:MAG: lyso-ornithine lipid O-acyltransferase [Alkalilacustris sp.]
MSIPRPGRADPTWRSPEPPPAPLPRRGLGLWRCVWRGGTIGLVTFGGLAVLLLLRLLERPLFGRRRPVTPWITVGVCRATLRLLGLRRVVQGQPMEGRGVVVANHVSWLDIHAINAPAPVVFVSKSEVAGWPGIGWLARATGTLFVSRNARDAADQRHAVEDRLRAGDRLVLFPEGTSTDGRQVLAFKPTLLAALFAADLACDLQVQPVSLRYRAPKGLDDRVFAWWGDMAFAGHLLSVLAAPPGGCVELRFHPALRVADFADRKALASACEDRVRAGVSPQTPPCR